jgi:hypothetical protein
LSFEKATVLSHISVEINGRNERRKKEVRKEGRRASSVNTSLQTSKE